MNTLKNEFDEIVKLCEERVEEYGENGSFFLEPATEEEIVEWESENNTKIPEDYKEWLRLTKTCQMCQTTAALVFPKSKQPEYLPSDYVLIGYVVGDGEVLCFSRSTGKYITYFEGKVHNEYESFEKVLAMIKSDIKDELPEINLTEDRIKAILEKAEELKRQKGNK